MHSEPRSTLFILRRFENVDNCSLTRLTARDNQEAFVEAVRKDLARPQLETIIAEVNFVKGEINESLTKLVKWATPRSVQTEGIWRLTKAKM